MSNTCKICGGTTFQNANGEKVHNGGGKELQKCRACGWSGGQFSGFVSCPRCGDRTNMYVDHIAA